MDSKDVSLKDSLMYLFLVLDATQRSQRKNSNQKPGFEPGPFGINYQLCLPAESNKVTIMRTRFFKCCNAACDIK